MANFSMVNTMLAGVIFMSIHSVRKEQFLLSKCATCISKRRDQYWVLPSRWKWFFRSSALITLVKMVTTESQKDIWFCQRCMSVIRFWPINPSVTGTMRSHWLRGTGKLYFAYVLCCKPLLTSPPLGLIQRNWLEYKLPRQCSSLLCWWQWFCSGGQPAGLVCLKGLPQIGTVGVFC